MDISEKRIQSQKFLWSNLTLWTHLEPNVTHSSVSGISPDLCWCNWEQNLALCVYSWIPLLGQGFAQLPLVQLMGLNQWCSTYDPWSHVIQPIVLPMEPEIWQWWSSDNVIHHSSQRYHPELRQWTLPNIQTNRESWRPDNIVLCAGPHCHMGLYHSWIQCMGLGWWVVSSHSWIQCIELAQHSRLHPCTCPMVDLACRPALCYSPGPQGHLGWTPPV